MDSKAAKNKENKGVLKVHIMEMDVEFFIATITKQKKSWEMENMIGLNIAVKYARQSIVIIIVVSFELRYMMTLQLIQTYYKQHLYIFTSFINPLIIKNQRT